MTDDRILAFDESGNTGSDLLQKEQPVFILASVKLSLKEATELKSIFNESNNELKFTKLKGNHRNYKQIISFLNHDLINDETIKLSVFHKDYCISAQTVDHLIESVYYNKRMNIYENGLNLAYANLLHYIVPVLYDTNLWEKYKREFIIMFQKRDNESIAKFYSTVKLLINSRKSDTDSWELLPILESRNIINNILDDWDKQNFDNTLSGFIGLIDFWGRKTEEKFYAYVDNSKVLSHFKDYLDTIKNINITQQIIGSDRRTLQLPLKLIDIKFEDSKENIVVQIADLIAGAGNHYYRALADERFKDDLFDKICETKLTRLSNYMVWPHISFSPKELNIFDNGKPNVLESIIKLSFKQHRNS